MIHIVLFIVSAMAAQQKMVLVTSSLSPSEILYTCNDLIHLVGFVVDKMFYNGCLTCPLNVTVDIGRCYWTTMAVSPGHAVKWYCCGCYPC